MAYLNGDSVGWLGPIAVGLVVVGLAETVLGVLAAVAAHVIDRRRR